MKNILKCILLLAFIMNNLSIVLLASLPELTSPSGTKISNSHYKKRNQKKTQSSSLPGTKASNFFYKKRKKKRKKKQPEIKNIIQKPKIEQNKKDLQNNFKELLIEIKNKNNPHMNIIRNQIIENIKNNEHINKEIDLLTEIAQKEQYEEILKLIEINKLFFLTYYDRIELMNKENKIILQKSLPKKTLTLSKGPSLTINNKIEIKELSEKANQEKNSENKEYTKNFVIAEGNKIKTELSEKLKESEKKNEENTKLKNKEEAKSNEKFQKDQKNLQNKLDILDNQKQNIIDSNNNKIQNNTNGINPINTNKNKLIENTTEKINELTLNISKPIKEKIQLNKIQKLIYEGRPIELPLLLPLHPDKKDILQRKIAPELIPEKETKNLFITLAEYNKNIKLENNNNNNNNNNFINIESKPLAIEKQNEIKKEFNQNPKNTISELIKEETKWNQILKNREKEENLELTENQKINIEKKKLAQQQKEEKKATKEKNRLENESKRLEIKEKNKLEKKLKQNEIIENKRIESQIQKAESILGKKQILFSNYSLPNLEIKNKLQSEFDNQEKLNNEFQDKIKKLEETENNLNNEKLKLLETNINELSTKVNISQKTLLKPISNINIEKLPKIDLTDIKTKLTLELLEPKKSSHINQYQLKLKDIKENIQNTANIDIENKRIDNHIEKSQSSLNKEKVLFSEHSQSDLEIRKKLQQEFDNQLKIDTQSKKNLGNENKKNNKKLNSKLTEANNILTRAEKNIKKISSNKASNELSKNKKIPSLDLSNFDNINNMIDSYKKSPQTETSINKIKQEFEKNEEKAKKEEKAKYEKEKHYRENLEKFEESVRKEKIELPEQSNKLQKKYFEAENILEKENHNPNIERWKQERTKEKEKEKKKQHDKIIKDKKKAQEKIKQKKEEKQKQIERNKKSQSNKNNQNITEFIKEKRESIKKQKEEAQIEKEKLDNNKEINEIKPEKQIKFESKVETSQNKRSPSIVENISKNIIQTGLEKKEIEEISESYKNSKLNNPYKIANISQNILTNKNNSHSNIIEKAEKLEKEPSPELTHLELENQNQEFNTPELEYLKNQYNNQTNLLPNNFNNKNFTNNKNFIENLILPQSQNNYLKINRLLNQLNYQNSSQMKNIINTNNGIKFLKKVIK